MPYMISGADGPVLWDAAHSLSVTLGGYMPSPTLPAAVLAATAAVGTPVVATAAAVATGAARVKQEAASQDALDMTTPRNLLLCFAGLLALCVLIAHPRFLARLFASLSSRASIVDRSTNAFHHDRSRAERKVGGGDLDKGWILQAGKHLPRLLSPTNLMDHADAKSLAFMGVDDYYFSPTAAPAKHGLSDTAPPTMHPPPHIPPLLSRIPHSSLLSMAPFSGLPAPFRSSVTLPYLYLIACYLTVILLGLFWRSDLSPVTNEKGTGADYTRSGLVTMTQIPIAIALGVRGNMIGLCTGKGYERLKVLHKIVGRTTFLASVMHMSIYVHKWTAAGKFSALIKTPLVIAGFISWLCLALVAVTSLPWIRKSFYGLFEICHFVGVAGMLGALAMHVPVAKPWCAAAGLIYAFSVVISLCKTRTATAEFTAIASSQTTVISIPAIRSGWRAGQHVRVRIPALGLPYGLQGHPFTVASAPDGEGVVLRVKAAGDWTRRLLQFASNSSGIEAGALGLQTGKQATVLVEGPYGGLGHTLPTSFSSVLLIAGGSGITHALSIATDLVNRVPTGVVRARTVDLVWIVNKQEVAQPLMATLIELVNEAKSFETRCLAARRTGEKLPDAVVLRVKVFVTRSPASSPLDLLPTLRTTNVDQIFDHSDFEEPRSSPSAAEKEKAAYLGRSLSSGSASTVASGKASLSRSGSRQSERQPLSEITTQGGRPNVDLMTCELADETALRYRGRRDGVKPQGVLVTACGPTGMVDDVRDAVRSIGEWRTSECGGVELEEEQFGF